MRITQGKSIAISEGLVYFGCIVQMIFCAYLVIQGEITMGILLGALQIANYVVNPARQITSQLLEYKTVKPVIARVVAVLDGEEQVEATEKVSIAKAGQIQVEGLRFSYEGEQGSSPRAELPLPRREKNMRWWVAPALERPP